MAPTPSKKVCATCGVNRGIGTYTSPRGRVCLICQKARRKGRARNRHVETNYGLTSAEYDALKVWSEGKCMGCAQARSYNLHVDHDHAVERALNARVSVRGLLCASCNGVLRKARDSASTLYRLYSYLEHWPSEECISNVEGHTIDRHGK